MKEIVEKYIKLRDKKAELTAEHKAKIAKIDEALAVAEGVLLSEFQKAGMESVRTESGTAYKTVRTQAGVADWDAVLDFIKANDLWSMLERRVSKQAVEQYREANNDLPPGINWREEVTINVRRS